VYGFLASLVLRLHGEPRARPFSLLSPITLFLVLVLYKGLLVFPFFFKQVNAFRVELQQQLRADLRVQRGNLANALRAADGDDGRRGLPPPPRREEGDAADEWVGLEKIRAGEFGANMLNDLKARGK